MTRRPQFDAFEDDWETLARHVDNATNEADDVGTEFDRLRAEFDRIEGLSEEAAGDDGPAEVTAGEGPSAEGSANELG